MIRTLAESGAVTEAVDNSGTFLDLNILMFSIGLILLVGCTVIYFAVYRKKNKK